MKNYLKFSFLILFSIFIYLFGVIHFNFTYALQPMLYPRSMLPPGIPYMDIVPGGPFVVVPGPNSFQSTPEFPSEMNTKAYPTFEPNTDGTYTMIFKFSNPQGRAVSISLNNVKWADPGPDPDTNGSQWTFNNVQPNTTAYINMKAKVDGVWSQIANWAIPVPAWVSPTPTPTDTPIPTQIPLVANANGTSGLGGLIVLILIVIGTIYLAKHKINSSKDKRAKLRKRK